MCILGGRQDSYVKDRLHANSVQDLRPAKLLVFGGDVENLGRTQRVFAAVMGCVLLSASILHGQSGVKLTYQPGVDSTVRVFVTDTFKQEAPSLTLVVREACQLGKGWKAVSQDEATRKDGWKWGLVLRGRNEAAPPPGRCKKLLWLTGDEFVAWATREFVLEKESAWVKGP